jgi:hypothetical protein
MRRRLSRLGPQLGLLRGAARPFVQPEPLRPGCAGRPPASTVEDPALGPDRFDARLPAWENPAR